LLKTDAIVLTLFLTLYRKLFGKRFPGAVDAKRYT